MTAAEYLLLAVASSFWPILVAIVVVALRTQHPVRALSAFLAGGLLTTVTIGIAIVFALEGASFVAGSRPPATPVVNIVVGVLALVAAAVVHGLERRPKRGRGRTERYVGSARLAFGAGVVLDIVPGFFPFVALVGIAEADTAAASKVALVVLFYVIMFALVEVPIVGYVLAPGRTVAVVERFNDWLDANGRRLGVWLLAGGGIALVVRGLLQL
jgi:hypothetical protein